MESDILKHYFKNIDHIRKSLDRVARRAIVENMEEILYVQTEMQWAHGLDHSGSIIGRYFWTTEYHYAKDPHNKPRAPKQKGEPYNLEWTGELFDTLAIKVNEGSYEIYSTTGKKKFVEEQLKTDLDLTPELNEYINLEIILPRMMQYILENFLKP